MLTPDQKKQIKVLGEKYGLDFIILYGSVAKKQQNNLSDVDIAVYRRGGITRQIFANLYQKLAVFFPNRELDLKSLSHTDPLFRYQVVRNGELLYGDQTAYNLYKAFAYRDYQEAKPLFQLEAYLVKKHQDQLKQIFLQK